MGPPRRRLSTQIEHISTIATVLEARSRSSPWEWFIGFMYAAAANTVLALFLQQPRGSHVWSSLVVAFFLLLFMGVDWASHFRIRSQIPEKFSPLRNFVKFILDLLTIVSLTAACVFILKTFDTTPITTSAPTSNITPLSTLESTQPTTYVGCAAAFGLFAVISGLWNLFILRVMDDLSAKDLFTLIAGLDMSRLQTRLSRYIAPFFDTLTRNYDQWRERSASLAGAEHNAARRLRHRCEKVWLDTKRFCVPGLVELAARFCSFHVLCSNVTIGGLLLFRKSAVIDLGVRFVLPRSLILLMMAFTLLVVAKSDSLGQDAGVRVVFCKWASWVLLLAFVFTYLTMSPEALMWTLALQQVLAIGLIQFYAFARNTSDNNTHTVTP